MRLPTSSRLSVLPLIALAVALGLVLAGCGGGSGDSSRETDAQSEVSGGKAGLVDVSSVEGLRARFNDDAGVPRLLLLLSPT